MSRENVEIVKAAFSAWNTGDMDAHNALYHPDAVVWQPEGWPEGPFLGREAVLRQFKQMRETWDTDLLEAREFIDVGNRVAVRLVWHGAGHGPEADLELTGIYTVRDGRVLAVEFIWDHAEALQAVGLSEQDATSTPDPAG
jgi:ketosteroid isomerase-like protein